MNALRKTYFLIREIGLPSLASYASYSLHKKLGFYNSARLTSSRLFSTKIDPVRTLSLPILNFDPHSEARSTVFGSAEEILHGVFHPFGGDTAPLDLSVPKPLKEWSAYSDSINGRDIKEVWEPARFTWALTLVEAFVRTREDRYIECFWKYFEEFQSSNPCYFGPNWMSAQEVALRAINWLLIFPVLKTSSASSPALIDALVQSLWQHLLRLPPTIDYAKAQNNNHLLSESLGLFLLGSFFAPQSRYAEKWKTRGSSLFEKTLLAQIAPDGTYCQQSSNYHRMMLHLALIYKTAQDQSGHPLPQEITRRLAQAVFWLQAQFDPISGRATNLGHNDGTLLLPFGCREYSDYRPTLQAASLAFSGNQTLPIGNWDELPNLLGFSAKKIINQPLPSLLRIGNESLWASLRAVHFNERPGHADQLHTEIWWEGINIACDAGTYSYNDPPPWQNALMSTRVHNTVTVDDLDQMFRAGKFLWLKKARTTTMPVVNKNGLSAFHDGYKELGVRHQRTITHPNGQVFLVKDEALITVHAGSRLITLHWLLPDWLWQWEDGILTIHQENREVEVSITCQTLDNVALPIEDIRIIRAGVTLLGSRQDQVMGWISPTYNVKLPALSVSISWYSEKSIEIFSTWRFSKEKS